MPDTPRRRIALQGATYPDSAILRAVEALGGPTATASVCDTTARTVTAWLHAGRVPGSREAVLLSRATGESVEALAGMEPG